MTTLSPEQLALLQLVTSASPETNDGSATGDDVSRPDAPAHDLTSITVDPDGAFIPAGGTLQFHAVGDYADGVSEVLTGQVNWSADPSDVVSIAQGGMATAQSKPGTARITASLGSIPGTATVRAAALQGIELEPDRPLIPGGSVLRMKAMGRYSDGGRRNLNALVDWSAAPDGVVSIDADGVVTALRVTKSAVITATTVRHPGTQFSAQTPVAVSTPVLQSVKIRPDSPMVVVGQPIRFTASGHYSDGREDTDETQALHWSWEPAELLVMEDTVGKRGLATASDQAGTVTVTALDPNNPSVRDAVTIQVAPPQVSEAPDPETVRRQDQREAHDQGYADGKEGRQIHRDELAGKGEPGLGGRMAAYDVGYREGRKADGAKAVDPHVEVLSNLTLVELSDSVIPEYWLLQDQQGYANLIDPYLTVREQLRDYLANVDAKNATREQLGPDVVKAWTQALNEAGDLRQRLALATVLMWDAPIATEKQRLKDLRAELEVLEAKHRVIEKDTENWEEGMAAIELVLKIGDAAEVVLTASEGLAEHGHTDAFVVLTKAGTAEAKSKFIETGIAGMQGYYEALTLVGQGLSSLKELHQQMEARSEDIATSLRELGRLTQHQEHAQSSQSTAALKGPAP